VTKTTTKRKNLIRRDNGWTAHIRVGGTQRWQTFHTEAEATQWLEKMRSLRGGGRSSEWTNPKFADYARRWLDEDAALRVRPATLARYRQLVEHHLNPQFGKRRLAQISAEDVSVFVRDWLAKGPLFEERQKRAGAAEDAAATREGRERRTITLGASPQTVTHGVNVASAIVRSAVRDRCALLNPFAATPRPSIPFNERPSLAPDDLARLFRQLDARWLPFYVTLAGTGLRFSEASALRWRDIDLTRARLTVSRRLARDGSADAPKTARSRRTVPLPATVTSLLRAHYLRAQHKGLDDLVFCNREGRPLSDSNLRKRVLAPALRAAGLPEGGHHQFRHSYVSNAIAAGMPIGYISRVVGHSSISTTMDKYGHLLSDSLDEAGSKVDDFVFRQHPQLIKASDASIHSIGS
jgi:integrase